MLERYLSPFREFGPADGLLYATDRALARLASGLRLYCYDLMAQPVPDHRILPAHVAEKFVIRQIHRDDPEAAAMPVRPEIRDARYAQNAICLGAFRRGELIGYIWFAFGEYEEDEVRCTFVVHPPLSSVFDFDLYVFPEHRMSFAFMAIWDGANAFLRSRGIRRSFSRLTRFNTGSRRAHLKLGSKAVGQAMFFKAWRIEFMVANISPYVHASWSPTRRARIALHPHADTPQRLDAPAADVRSEP